VIKSIYSLSPEEREQHQKMFGGYNQFPPGWTEITQEQFAKSDFFTYSPVLAEHRQMHATTGSTEPVTTATLWWLPGFEGFALVNDYWKGTVRFFRFGCKHEWGDAREELAKRGRTLFSTEKAHYCIKCGHFFITDSSD